MFPAVRVVRLGRQRGFCVAVNRGLESAAGEIVEVLNDDTIVTQGWAEAALRHFDDPEIVAVAPLVLQWPITGRGIRIDSAGDSYHPGGFARKIGNGRRLATASLRAGSVAAVSAAAAFYRHSRLRAVGYFDESFKSYFEDVDLSLRLTHAGGQIVYDDGSVVWHRVGSSHGRPRRQLLEQQSCNEERVFWRNLPSRQRAWTLMQHLGVLAGKSLLRWEEGQLLPFVMGRLRAVQWLPADLRHRINRRQTP
jgi:hypothetical protein